MSVALPAEPYASIVYVEWVRTVAPDQVGHAEELVERVAERLRRGYEKPGRAVDDLRREANALPAHHRPWFWDTVGHRMSAAVRGSWRASRAQKAAASCYTRAREAEREYGLPIDTAYAVENALLFARHGTLPGKELATHQRWLTETFPAEDAHREFVRFALEWGRGGGPLAADLPRRLRATAKAAGLGLDEDARVLGEVLAGARTASLPDGLLDGAAKVFAKAGPDDGARQGLVDLLPDNDTDGGALLRMLDAAGLIDAMAVGEVEPTGGLAAWLGRFPYQYGYERVAYGGVTRQPMAEELFGVIERLAPRVRAAGVPVRIHQTRYRHGHVDADLADALLAAGIPIADTENHRVHFWGEASRRDLTALAADPVLGKRLEGTVHASRTDTFTRRPVGGTALSVLSNLPGLEKSVQERLVRLIRQVEGGGLQAADDAMTELDGLLDLPTIDALKDIEDPLAGLDLVGPLGRALRDGIPAELGWPALDAAVEEIGEVVGVTATWPVLTVYGADRAIAVDHAGRRGACSFPLPEGARVLTVHYAGGDFLVGVRTTERTSSHHERPELAFWASSPEDRFIPGDPWGMNPCHNPLTGAFGFQFATADGRHDGERVLRPGDRHGIGRHERQLSDGTRVWSADSRIDDSSDWAEVDPATGERVRTGSLPAFFTEVTPPEGKQWSWDDLSYAPLPDGVTSPLGQANGVVGFRIMCRTKEFGVKETGYEIEGVDGRRATFAGGPRMGDPWGILRMPEGGADMVVTQHSLNYFGLMRAHAADGTDTAMWEVRAFPNPQDDPREDPQNRPVFPPPAFWHFLTPRDPASSKALRNVTDDAVRELLRAGPGREADAVARVLPEVTHPAIAAGVAEAVARAARVLRLRETVSDRVARVRSGALVRPPVPVPDTELTAALRVLLGTDVKITSRPGILTSILVEGSYLAGEIDETTREMSRTGLPRDWLPLLGRIDAVAWRLVSAATRDEERPALAELLRAWTGTPFARPGTWRTGKARGSALTGLARTGVLGPITSPTGTYAFVQPVDAPEPADATGVEVVTIERDDAARLRRLLELYEEHGPVRPGDDAVDAFAAATGVRRVFALLALDGLPWRRHLGSDFTTNFEAHDRMLRAKPYKGSKSLGREYESVTSELTLPGRLELLAAGIPDDPAELWAPGGDRAAAERMARVWADRIGVTVPLDEAVLEGLEKELGLSSGMSEHWARWLAEPRTGDPADPGFMLAAGKYGMGLYRKDDHGEPGQRHYDDPYKHLVSVLLWALTERPVGGPALAGVPSAHDHLRGMLDSPNLYIPLGVHALASGKEELAARFGPGTHPVPKVTAQSRDCEVHDDGLLVIDTDGHYGWQVYVRTSGFADPEAFDRVLRTCAAHGLDTLADAVRAVETLYDSGLARMVARMADSPVPAGRYEANPRLSVPGLVAEVAEETGTSEDAAALYLQLLTLARPTDRNVRKWNGWSPAKHKKAQAELAELGLIDQGKRSRAGRTAFVPGQWTDLKAPNLPVETSKLRTHLARVNDKKEVTGPHLVLLPPVPLHEMFANAWSAR
ncbi:hypothetical protein [Actinomadura kijaniata]|uniref:hypothetical protein n=1 Tax=Actinomadura kijaniata TaxID=46161 RepID=UPI00082E9B96|nr:hypothetical protein [Actinomadura kijaniata]